MSNYVLNIQETGSADIAIAGGKAANLGELHRIEGIRVPAGFCISTKAFSDVLQHIPAINSLLDRLSLLTLADPGDIALLSAEIRELIEGAPIPQGIAQELSAYLDTDKAYAIRSSATAEDLPSASFAGQQDTYLNIPGIGQILEHIRKCQASLFTERAVLYRIRNGIDHRKVRIAVIVQEMMFPEASGILFTADPVTGNRKVVSVDAGFGLGEAFVSGLVSADCYKVQDKQIRNKIIATKKRAIYGLKQGGTETREIAAGQQKTQTLTDDQILQLASVGRKIEAHFGSPQDIEWCLAEGQFYIVQSRPVTTLFPVPEVQDKETHIYISVGHNQMMTDAMKPLGLSFFLQTTRAPMTVAGGRLFVDVTKTLASPAGRKNMIDNFGKTDHLIKDALLQAAEKVTLVADPDQDKNNTVQSSPYALPPVPDDPAIVDELMGRNKASVAALKEKISGKSGLALFDCIREDLPELKRISFDPQSSALIMTTMNAALWLNEKMYEWLGEKNAADILSQSVPHNITAQMGLDLMDVADSIRPYPKIVSFLQQAKDNYFAEELPRFEGGNEAAKAIQDFLDQYGMRCAGEIDITRPRWSEQPLTLVPVILGNIRNFAPGESSRKFEQGRLQALAKAQELLERLQQLPDGAQKARETKQMIGQLRNFSGYREYPKYGIVSRYLVYKQALLEEAKRLVQAGVLTDPEDSYYLRFEEFRTAVQTQQADTQLISKRKEEFKLFEKLSPPRVMSSDGEIIRGKYKMEDIPDGAIAGLPVSSGVVEGRARVFLDMAGAGLEEGDILVTKFTDPSWTTLFVSIKGLVTEVGGLMTHGAVIAREYGIAAVVGIENATILIKDGQRIRVNGTDGYVELL
jgi:phosphoenolpyruvate synthase/pyruvate phosphate dikinase